MHIEGLNIPPRPKIIKRGVAAGWNRLQKWYDMSWRSCGLVWNLTNPLGGGTNDTSQGLTQLGKEIIQWLQERSMIIDFAHMNEKTFWDVAEIVLDPIVVSHANTRNSFLNQRNLTNDQLRKVAESGGVVGVFLAKKFVTGNEKATVADVIDHVDHMQNIMGIDHIALGTDFGGIISGFPKGLESVDKLPALWKELKRRNYSEDDIEKIAYKNAAKVLVNTLSPREKAG